MVKRLLLSALLLGSLTSAALAERTRVRPAHKAVKTRILKADKAPRSAGQKVSVDPETGKVRAPSGDEVQAMAPANVAPAALTETTFSDGTVQLDLGDAYMVDVVATRRPDGTVSTDCVPHGAAGAAPARGPEAK